MGTEVKPGDWTELDPWWSAYMQTLSVGRSPPSAQTLDTTGLPDCWDDFDSWWRTYTDTSPHVRDSTRTLVTERLTDSWNELDPWWDGYAKTGYEKVVKIADLLDESNEAWRQSPAPFDTDPLAAAVTSDEGPLLPSHEESWSDWLAKILRPSAALVTEIFDVPVQGSPENIVREDQLLKEEGGFRRPDLLLFHTDRGISVEVKLGDEHYEKTAETALLAEDQYDYEWHHTLLLPKRKRSRLGTIVEPPVSSPTDDRPEIEWENPGPIAVVYWRDVTAAIRTLLCRGDVIDDHWAANAYLFCAAAEQQLLNFQPQPTIERMAQPLDVVETMHPIVLADALEEQLTYLRARENP